MKYTIDLKGFMRSPWRPSKERKPLTGDSHIKLRGGLLHVSTDWAWKNLFWVIIENYIPKSKLVACTILVTRKATKRDFLKLMLGSTRTYVNLIVSHSLALSGYSIVGTASVE